MRLPSLEPIRKLQEFLLELGVSRSVLSLPAPRMLALAPPTAEAAEPAVVFLRVVSELEIANVCRDLFVSGHYSLAVQEAFKAVDRFVKAKSGLLHLTGSTLMDQAFSPKSPVLRWTSLLTQSQKDEQLGYHRLFSGAMLGIRNPVTHEFNWVDDSETALELITFAQHLLRKARIATAQAALEGDHDKS